MRTTSRAGSALTDMRTRMQPLQTPSETRFGFDLAPADDADHAAIHQLLRAVFQRPSAAAFQTINDDPQYDPTDRLVVKRSDEVIAHVHLTPRVLKFGQAEVRATELRHLATLPEYRDRGLADRLLENALDDMSRNGSVVAITRTASPKLYRQRGWVTCGNHCQSDISPRDLLAHLEASSTRRKRSARKSKSLRRVCTRIWRQHELDEVARIYDSATEDSYGPLVRRQSHWRWLMSRRTVYDHAFVAFECDKPCEEALDNEETGPIVGYAAMRGDRIVEFATAPDDTMAIRRLLARMCREAIENGRHSIGLVAPIDHPAHELIVAAGGKFASSTHYGGREIMAKVLDQAKLLHLLKPALWDRVRDRSFEANAEVEMRVDDAVYRFTINKRSVGISAQRSETPHVLEMTKATFDQLILGYHRIEEQLEAGTIKAQTEEATALATCLFPQVPFWRPLLDDLTDR